MMTAKKAKSIPETLSIRTTPADRELLSRLQAKTGLSTLTEVTRQGWRALARKEKV
jgi:hypothetical protein